MQEAKKTIIIAEDDTTSFKLLKVYLAGGNYEIIRTINGEQTIEQFKNNPHTALILMDLKMHGIDGYEATREIKKLNPELPIIAQTAYALTGDETKALEAGCDAYVTKPIKKDDFLALISRYL